MAGGLRLSYRRLVATASIAKIAWSAASPDPALNWTTEFNRHGTYAFMHARFMQLILQPNPVSYGPRWHLTPARAFLFTFYFGVFHMIRKDESIGTRICLGVVSDLGGVNFWFDFGSGRGNYYGGIEKHLYAESGKCDNEKCWLLDAPCNHDGSSLMASEKWIPLYLTCQSKEEFWRALEVFHSQIFEDS